MHLVGFIIKKLVTMHGHMNVKSSFLFAIFFTNVVTFALVCAEEFGNNSP